MIDTPRIWFHDTVTGFERNEPVDPEFSCLLQHPVHLFTLQEGLPEHDLWDLARRGGFLANDASVDHLRCDMRDLDMISGAIMVG